jgi:hypothetical protein
VNSLERFYRWSNNYGDYLASGHGAWLSRFLLPAVPLLLLSCVLFALEYSLGGVMAMGAFTLWGLLWVLLALRDLGPDVMKLVRKVLR